MNWLLPDSIADALPNEAVQIEIRRRAVLDLFSVHGYERVIPPLIEYLDSLLTGVGRDLNTQTFKLTDRLSGKTLGIRADMTPQAARIDAHLLNRNGVVRLCYCGSTLHTIPHAAMANREPLQIGAEVYGYPGLEADIEIIRLMSSALTVAGLPAGCIGISHVGIFHSLSNAAGLALADEDRLLHALQHKDRPALTELTAALPLSLRQAFLELTALYGDKSVLDEAARVLPDHAEIAKALVELRRLADILHDQPLLFDLADLRGYHYHNGVVFAAYHAAAPDAIALGGRYDGVGQAFGRSRPATGFSMDLREVVHLAGPGALRQGIAAPYTEQDEQLAQKVRALRAQGEIVVESLPGEVPIAGPPCDRHLVLRAGQWQIEPLG